MALDPENLSPYIAAHFRRIMFTDTSEYRNTEQSRFEERKFRAFTWDYGLDEARIYGERREILQILTGRVFNVF